MDRFEETANVIKKINEFHNSTISNAELVKEVCGFFDKIKNETLNKSDLKFLKYISNTSGIPHYYDLLEKLEKTSELEDFSLNTFSSLLYESTLYTSDTTKVHRFQKEILELFQTGQANRFFLSASTSFGKTHVIFEIIKKMNYKNIVLIFPTIALLSENLEKITTNPDYIFFKENYSIHTLSEVKEFSDRNLFIYTPERFLSFLERNSHPIKFDFAFIDEIYKIDNDYIIDEETKENERDVAYRLSVFYALDKNVDVILAGPYIEFFKKVQKENPYNPSFDIFLQRNNIKLLDFNEYEIVNKDFTNIKSKKRYDTEDGISFKFEKSGKFEKLYEIISTFRNTRENTIVYCSARSYAEGYASKLADKLKDIVHNYENYADFIFHIEKNFAENWVLVDALKKGIGIHHSLIPKFIQKEIIKLFNNGELHTLFSTTTITEGVNTSAKNLVVLHSKKGDKDLKKFDAKNIAGRAGRFLYHFSGRVIVLENDFMQIIDSAPQGIKHKNYDVNAPKDEIDFFYSADEFLNEKDIANKKQILEEQASRNIPDEIFNLYKVISRKDKITLYDEIILIKNEDLLKIKALISKLNFSNNINYDGFQIIIEIILKIIKNQKLRFLIENKNNSNYSSITHLLFYYLRDGFKGSINFKMQRGLAVDHAISQTADFVYNILKYQLVKYLGVFNVLYRYIISIREQKSFEEITGIDKLLVKLEYNALTDIGKIVSDFGVPQKIVDYYENQENNQKIFESFDEYEKIIFEKVRRILE